MKTIEEINEIRRKQQELAKESRIRIYVHMGTCGIASGAMDVLSAVRKQITETGRRDITVIKTGCAGICSREPLMTVSLPGEEAIMYEKLDAYKTRHIFSEHVLGGRVVEEYAFARGMECQIQERKTAPKTVSAVPGIEEIPFFALQEQRVMRNRGLIDPNKIDDYIGRDGYQGVVCMLTSMTAEEIVDTVLNSGLRGRGGAGYPTGKKWAEAARETNPVKYLLCNADEGDPGAYMDRNVLESDPHSVIEGMIIAAKAIGAHNGCIYCRAEYPLAIETVTKAIRQARGYGLLGENILGTGFNFDIEVFEGAGAFVCGEGTAMIASIEGGRGVPRTKPPHSVHSGLWNKPTVTNNVETFANVAQIITNGSEWFSAIGTERSKGTKIFSLTGDVNNVGCVEVPMGSSISYIVDQIGGGVPDGKHFKAAQLGGPSGGCIPFEHMDVSVDYETLQKYGAIMGSGGLIVMGNDRSAVEIAQFFMEFCKDEACGKCIPGREGTKQLLILLNRLCENRGTQKDIELIEELCGVIRKTALCGLCKSAVNPVLSTLRYFRNDYLKAVAAEDKEAKK